MVYVNGQPVTPRNKTNPHGNLDIGGKVEHMDELEVVLRRYFTMLMLNFTNRMSL